MDVSKLQIKADANWQKLKSSITNDMRIRISLANNWKIAPKEFETMDHGYSLVSGYYDHREIDGIHFYKITTYGIHKIKLRQMVKETHNFLVYLSGKKYDLYKV